MGTMHKNKVDIIGLAETNIAWNDKHKRDANSQTIKHYKKSHIIQTSSSIETSYSSYQPGGAATITTGNYTGRIESAINDPSGLGRWSGFKLRCTNHKFLYIITAYCPHIDYKHGSDTCYQQQWRILRNQSNVNPEPRCQMLYDLKILIFKIHEAQGNIILQWDANNKLESNELQEFFAEINLYNIYCQSNTTISAHVFEETRSLITFGPHKG
jgi:hypothetical protein